MDKNKILGMVDHTLLKQDATWEQIREILDDGMTYHTASACIPASYVKQAAEYVRSSDFRTATVRRQRRCSRQLMQ